MTRIANQLMLLAALTLVFACPAGCNRTGSSEEGDDTDTVTQPADPKETDSDSESESDTETETDDTESLTEDTESETEDTTPTTGRVFGVVALLGSETAEGVTVAILDHEQAQVDAVETEAGGEYEFAEVAPGDYTVAVSKPGYVNDERRVEVTAGSDLELSFTLQVDASGSAYRLEYVGGGSNEGTPDQRGTVGRALSEALRVRLVDGSGEPVSFAPMNFEVIDGRSGGAVDSEDIVTGPDGEAANGYSLGTTAGRNHVRVWSPAGGNSVHFYPMGLADVPAELSAVSGDNQTGQVGAALPKPISVLAKDQYGNAVPGAEISFSAGSEGSAAPQKATTDGSGVAQTSWTLGSKLQVEPPQQALVANAFEVELTLHATNISRAPSSIAIVSGDGQSARSGQPLAAPFVVEVKDDLGNPGYGHSVAWSTSTGGSVAPASSSIGQDGFAEAQGTMGALLEQEFFATISDGNYVTFLADKVGDTKVSLTEPMLVWPGYPDASALNPEDLEVPLTIRGTGFGPEAVVVWNAGSADEEELVPASITATKIVINVSADHFEEIGTYPVAVRNLETDGMQSFDFKVAHTLLAPSSQDSSRCTKSVLSGWEWTECSEIRPEDEAYGQDGHYEEKAGGRWETTDEGTAYDNITGLTWARCAAGQSYNAHSNDCEGTVALPGVYSKARGLCDNLELGGYKDWRVPTAYELLTIRQEFSYGYNADVFPQEVYDFITSTSLFEDGRQKYKKVTLPNLYINDFTSPTPVQCVRGLTVAREMYTADMSTGTRIVTDEATGLMWNACPLGTKGSECFGKVKEFTWSEALAACEELVAGGVDDWRLASSKELMTLLNLMSPPVSSQFWGSGTNVLFGSEDREWSVWSSTTDTTHGEPVMALYLEYWGSFSWDKKDMPSEYNNAGALCVRLGY